MSDDILERAKAADIDSLAGTDWGALREIVQGLIAEVERLRSQSVEQVFRRKNEEIAAKDARIKELESEITAWVADRDSWIGRYEAVRKDKDARIADQEAYIERLEAAFLSAMNDAGLNIQEANEALERIKVGGKD